MRGLGGRHGDGADVELLADAELRDAREAAATQEAGRAGGEDDLDGPAEALQLLRPRVAVPIHWGTYKQFGLGRSDEALRAPAEAFAQHAAELAPDVDVRLLPVGGTVELETPIAAGAQP